MLEMFMDPLGALVITFFAMAIISILAVVLMYLLKNEKTKIRLLYFLSAWGVVIAYCGILSTPFDLTGRMFSIVALGVLGIAGLLIQLFSKRENKFQVARVMVTISVVVGMVQCFLI